MVWLAAVAAGTGEHHNHPVALLQPPPPGDGVTDAAVQIALAVDLKDGKEQGHGAAGLEDGGFLVPPGDGQVVRLAGVQVGDHRLHLAGEGGKGVVIEGHQLVWDGAEAEFQPEIAAVALVRQVAPAHVPPVRGEAGDHLQIAPGLPGHIAHPIGDARRHADDIVRHNTALQQSIAHAAGKNCPEGPALQHQSCFHKDLPRPCRALFSYYTPSPAILQTVSISLTLSALWG